MFYDYMIYIVFDFMMAVIMFLFGMWFYKSEGKAANFLSGYNMKSADERKKYDENAMCKAYGKRMMFIVRRHIVGGANRTLFSVDLPPRLCRTGT